MAGHRLGWGMKELSEEMVMFSILTGLGNAQLSVCQSLLNNMLKIYVFGCV